MALGHDWCNGSLLDGCARLPAVGSDGDGDGLLPDTHLNATTPGQLAVGTALNLLSLVTFVGNAMVMHAFRTEKRLQTVSNMFIMSLAAADLIVGLFVMPLGSLYAIKGKWLLGLTTCRLWLIVDYIASTASILNLCILSLDRYWSITTPLKYLRKRTNRRAMAMISSAWLISSSWIWPVVFWDWLVTPGGWDDTSVCETSFAKNWVFKLVAAVFNFYIPWVSMMYLYARMFSAIRQRSKLEVGRFNVAHRPGAGGLRHHQLCKRSVSLPQPHAVRPPAVDHGSYGNLILLQLATSGRGPQLVGRYDGVHVQIELADEDVCPRSTPNGGGDNFQETGLVLQNEGARSARGGPTNVIEHRQTNGHALKPAPLLGSGNIILQREKKAAVQLGVIMGAFICCWLPYSILFVAVAWCDSCVDENVYLASIWLGYLNSALNPVLYPLCNATFKRAFRRMLGLRREESPRLPLTSSPTPRHRLRHKELD